MLLTLDLSTVQSGYCVGAAGRRPRWGVFRPGNLSRDERIAYMAASVAQLCQATGVNRVVAEAVSVGSFSRADGTKGAGNLMSAVALAEVHGAVKFAIRPQGLRMETLNLSTARKDAGVRLDLGIKGAPNKDDCRRWLAAKGYPTMNGDEADALVLWRALLEPRTTAA